MNGQIKIRVEYITFSVFVLFLLIIGLSGDQGFTGFIVRDFDKDDLWLVEFKTEDRNDLVIEVIEGDGYSNLDDVEFVELKCGEDKVIPNILTNKIVYEGYECDEKSYVEFKVNSEGLFKQRVSYEDSSRTISFRK